MNKSKEYFTLKEIAEMNNMSVQNVRKRLNEIEQTELLVMKDYKGAYIILKQLLNKFRRIRTISGEPFAYTIDCPSYHSEEDIKKVVADIMSSLDDTKIEYTIQSKGKNDMLHIHSIITTNKKNKVLNRFYKAFYGSYKVCNLFDEDNWINYISRNGEEIITINNIC